MPAARALSRPGVGSAEAEASVSQLLVLAERIVERLADDRSAEAHRLAEDAEMFAVTFRLWLGSPPKHHQRLAAARRFFQFHHRVAEYVSRCSGVVEADHDADDAASGRRLVKARRRRTPRA